MIYDEGMSKRELREYLTEVVEYNEKLKCEVKRLEDLRDDILYNYHSIYRVEEMSDIVDNIEDICMKVKRLINKKTMLEVKIRALIDSYDIDKIDRYGREIQQLEDYIYELIKDR